MYFINQTSCIKLILFIGNSNEKNYYSELHLKKMRLVSLDIVIILRSYHAHTAICSCVATISTTFLDFVHFCFHLFIMGFKQISAEARANLVQKQENLRDLLQRRLGLFAKVCKECLSCDGGQESLFVSFNVQEKRKSSKRFDRTLVRLFMADRKLTFKE